MIVEIRALNPDFFPDKLSDHSILLTHLRYAEPLVNNTVIQNLNQTQNGVCPDAKPGDPKPKRYKVNEIKPDFMTSGDSVRSMLEQIEALLELRLAQEEVDRWYSDFIALYHQEMDKFYRIIADTPRTLKNYYISRKEWWNDTLDKLSKSVHTAEKTYLSFVKKKANCTLVKRDFLAKQRLFDKEVKRTKRRWQRNKVLELDKANVDDPNAFWEFIKALRGKKKSKLPDEVYLNDDVTTTTDPQVVLDTWERDFGSLFAPPDKTEDEVLFKRHVEAMNDAAEALMDTMSDEILNADFSMEEIDKILSKSKNGKAPGLDSIVYEVLKNNVSKRALVALFNYCLSSGLIPTTWCRAIINPIPKSASSDPRVPLNYRGISLLPVISKLYTGAIATRVGGFLEKNNKLANEQNGFRPDRSCVDHIFTLCDLLRIRKAENKETFCSFVDFKKAFDYVDHSFLLHKLIHIGINGRIYNTIKTLYSRPESCVLVNDRLSGWFPVQSGVRQGDSLSPMLFAVFINDLAEEIRGADIGLDFDNQNIALLMYADDIVLLNNSYEDAQKALDILSTWCARWGMKVNIAKSQTVHCRNPQRPRCDVPLVLSGEPMEYVENYKYLGCWINEFVSNDKTVTALTAAASRSYGRIVNIFKKMSDMGCNTYCSLYQSYVVPIATYGAAVWGYNDFQAPKVLQNRINRFYLGVHRFAPVAATSIEMNVVNLRQQRWLEMLRMHNRLVEMKTHRYPRLVYQYDITHNKSQWYREVCDIAKQFHLPKPTMNVKYDMDAVSAAALKLSQDLWWRAAKDKPKLRTYIDFTDVNEPRTLVKANLPRNQRSLLAKLLCGILPLEVETGRFVGKDKKDRFCTVCRENKIEDEYHFLYKCPKLKPVRKAFYAEHIENPKEFKKLPDSVKTKTLLHSEMLKNTGVFIEKLFMARRDNLFGQNV